MACGTNIYTLKIIGNVTNNDLHKINAWVDYTNECWNDEFSEDLIDDFNFNLNQLQIDICTNEQWIWQKSKLIDLSVKLPHLIFRIDADTFENAYGESPSENKDGYWSVAIKNGKHCIKPALIEYPEISAEEIIH